MSEQLAFDFGELQPVRRDPFNCQHLIGVDGKYAICNYNGNRVYTSCLQSICGEPRRCVHEPVDNLPATMARRREWMRSHGE